MIISSQQIFDKVYLDGEDSSEFIEYVSSGVERELVNKLVDKLQDHNHYIVKLDESRFIEDLPSNWTAYRQDLEYKEVVQCKDCRRNFPWCQKFRDELDGNGFCPYGKPGEENDD